MPEVSDAPRTASPTPVSATTSAAPLPRWAVPVFFAGALVFLAAASCRSLALSEVRYVEAGHEMASGGDWIVPHLSFVPYFEKPVLAYWTQAVAQLLFGMSALAVHAPSIASCLVMLWATYATGRLLRGPRFGLAAAALLLSGTLFVMLGTAVMTDSVFAAFLSLAGWAYVRHDREPRGPWIWIFWGMLGLAWLTKGPLAVALAGMTVGAHLLIAGRWRDVAALRLVRGGLVVVAVNLPWHALVWARDPRFLEFFYVRENLRAAVDSEVHHGADWWFYVPAVAAAFFPLSLPVLWAVGAETFAAGRDLRRDAAAARDSRSDPGARFLLACMVVPPLLLLSVAQSKLATYVLPVLPGVALLASWHVADRVAHPTRALRALVPLTLLLAAAALAIGWPRFVSRDENAMIVRQCGPDVVAVIAILGAGFVAGAWLTLRGSLLRGFAVVAAGSSVATLCALPIIDAKQAQLDAVALVTRMCAIRAPGERVVLAGPCTQDYTVSLGVGERPYVWGFARETGMGHFTEMTTPDVPLPASPYTVSSATVPQNPWLLDDAELAELWNGPARAWFVGRAQDLERLRKLGLRAYELGSNANRVLAANRELPRE